MSGTNRLASLKLFGGRAIRLASRNLSQVLPLLGYDTRKVSSCLNFTTGSLPEYWVYWYFKLFNKCIVGALPMTLEIQLGRNRISPKTESD